MTKQDFVKKIAGSTGLTQPKSAELFEVVCNELAAAILGGETVNLEYIGKFAVKEYGERQGRNPATGEKIVIPPKKRLAFRVGGKLKKLLNEPKKSGRPKSTKKLAETLKK